MKEQIEIHRPISEKELEELKERWFVFCGGRTRKPIMDPMQKKVLVWAAIGFVIAVFYIALSLVTWKVLGLLGP